MWKRSTPLDLSSELQNAAHEAKASIPSIKRFRFGHDKISVSVKTDRASEHPDEECNSHARTINQVFSDFVNDFLLNLSEVACLP